MILRVVGRVLVGFIAFAVVVVFALTITSPIIFQHWDDKHLLMVSAVQFVGVYLLGWLTCWIVGWERARG